MTCDFGGKSKICSTTSKIELHVFKTGFLIFCEIFIQDILLYDIKEPSWRLVTFETFDQSDEET